MYEYFAQNLWQLWVITAFLLLILELTSGDFFILCFAIGAGITTVLSLTGVSFLWQLLAFAVFSILCMFFVRPVMIKYFHRNDPDRKSNADALIGRQGMVSETINADGHGRVAIDGDDWKAVSADNSQIDKGTKVRVVGLESIIITVEEC
ncbi:NfeD family protein [Prevotella sp. OH937_COT-195]|nr:NfeD family protein [Prevotella sp. OH937_COT-195]